MLIVTDVAVEEFFKQYAKFDTPEAVRKYVNWAVPSPKTIHDDMGRKIPAENHIFPYMYEYDNNHRMDASDRDVSGFLQSSSNY